MKQCPIAINHDAAIDDSSGGEAATTAKMMMTSKRNKNQRRSHQQRKQPTPPASSSAQTTSKTTAIHTTNKTGAPLANACHPTGTAVTTANAATTTAKTNERQNMTQSTNDLNSGTGVVKSSGYSAKTRYKQIQRSNKHKQQEQQHTSIADISSVIHQVASNSTAHNIVHDSTKNKGSSDSSAAVTTNTTTANTTTNNNKSSMQKKQQRQTKKKLQSQQQTCTLSTAVTDKESNHGNTIDSTITTATVVKLKHKQQRQQQQQQKQQQSHNNDDVVTKVIIPPNQPQTTNDINYGAGKSITVVHIAEKPSIGQAIAVGLSSSSNSSGGGGCTFKSYGKSLPIHELTSSLKFPKAPYATSVTHLVTSVAGHVYNVDFPTEYQSWDTVDPAELFHAPIVKKPCKGSVVKHLQDVIKGADFLVLWLDCDREGENICFEVLDVTLHLLRSGSGSGGGGDQYDRVYRAYFSAINPCDIQKAYQTLGKPDRCQSLSVDARQELDLKVGVAFSRFQTRFFQGRYGDLDSAVLSYGPCQTPTLGFCVARHVEIETFKSSPYFVLDLGIMNSGTMCRANWVAGRSFERGKVDSLVSVCKGNEGLPPITVVVTSVVTKDTKQGRPTPLNTVGLLKACSKVLGIGPHQALSVAERLYLSGYLSYPRTESTKYPNSFDIVGTLQEQIADNRWGSYVSNLLRTGAVTVASKGGVDMGDHPPITPCRYARAGELSGDMARVYDLVTRHFIASVSHDAVWTSTTVHLEIDVLDDKGQFTIRGKQLQSPGFLAIMLHRQYGNERDDGHDNDDDDGGEEEKALPEFKVGDQYGLFFSGSKKVQSAVNLFAHLNDIIPISNNAFFARSVDLKSDKISVTPSSGKFATLDVKERMTTPPTHLSESELISLMEKNNIGTDASISTHIENILKRNYVELIPGRKLKPSRLGLVLAQGYHLIDSTLILPQVRSDIELECNKIAKGLADRDDVVRKAIDMFSAKFLHFVENISRMDVLFGSSFAQLKDVGKPFTRCGLTKRYLQFIAGPPPRLYNKTTECVYPLPIGGEVKQWTGRTCPVAGCGFELCVYSVGAPPRTFPLCPNCYNNPRPEYGPPPGEDSGIAVKKGDEEDAKRERGMQRMAGKSMLRECPHPDKHPLIEEMTVSPDPESEGVLILDPHLGPKWRLVSTRQPTIVFLPKSVEKVNILEKTDEVLGCHLLSIEFKDGQSPIQGNKTKYVSCFATDELLQGLIRVHHGDERLKASSGRGGGGRSGRGRGGGRGQGGRRGRD